MTTFDRVLPNNILEKYRRKELIPPYNFTEGEYYLANFLDKKLPKEWTIHTRPVIKQWGSYMTKKTPDIVIVHKKIGIMVIEVKDWEFEAYNTFADYNYKKKGKQIWKVIPKSKQNYKGNKNPVATAEKYMWRMRDSITQILEEIHEDSRKKELIKCGVYFHNNYTTAEAKKFVGGPELEFLRSDRCNVFATDLLNDKTPLHDLIPLISNRDKISSKADWLTSFKNWISDPAHLMESKIIVSDRDLDEKQRHYTQPSPGVIQKLSGVAGGGKTKVIALRAAKLFRLGKKVLIVCFNITLRNYLESEIKNALGVKELPNNININHFHGFLRLYTEEREIPNIFDEDDEEVQKETINNCTKDKEKNPNETNNFDAVLIDEGQDFKEEWFKFIRLFLTENQEALIAIDEKQNIYGREKMKLKGVGAGKWGVLKRGYRLNNLHAKIANDFSKRFLSNGEDLETPYIELHDEKQQSLPIDPEPKAFWKNVNDIIEAQNQVFKILNYLDKEQKNEFSDTTVLVSEHSFGLDLKQYLLKKFNNKIKILDIFENKLSNFGRTSVIDKQKKMLFKTGTKKLLMCTIKSFKGWERRNIIIVTDSDENNKNKKKYYDQEIYTSLTRVREKLIVINRSEKYRKFGDENFEALN